jgi:origin recognition complex subunit 3
VGGAFLPRYAALDFGKWLRNELEQFFFKLINPSVRASVLSGLTSPHAYLSVPFRNASRDWRDDEIENDRGFSCLPDTSILFRRYLDSGKMINVWDWYESFVAACEVQREESKKAAVLRKARRGGSRSPTKASRSKSRPSRSTAVSPVKSKRKGKNVAPPDDDGPDEGDGIQNGDEDGGWRLKTQARFMRALHELDYVGLIRHTGRKKDCVMRTVWEGEWEEDQ